MNERQVLRDSYWVSKLDDTWKLGLEVALLVD